MKKFLMILFATVALATPSQAQFKFGAKAGLNLTNMRFSESGARDAVKNKAGFFIGPTVKFSLPIGLSFDASALYDHRSAKFNNGTEDVTLKEQTLQIPINVRYGVGLGSVVNLFAFAGPQFGFNLGNKTKEIYRNAANWTLKGSNVSANVGIGATLFGHVQVTANYNIALGKTGELNYKNAITNTWESVSNGKANAWQIAAAYYF